MFLNRRHIVKKKKQVNHAKKWAPESGTGGHQDPGFNSLIIQVLHFNLDLSCLTGKIHLRKKPECDCDTETYHRSLTSVTTNRYCRIAVLPSRGTSMITRKKFS